jgi:hypothetical protein
MSFIPSPSSLPGGRLRVCNTCNGCVCYDCLLVLVLVGVRPGCSTQSPLDRVASRTSTRLPPFPTSALCPYRTPFGRQHSTGERRGQDACDHQGPPFPTSSALAPTEFDGLFLAYLCTTQPWWWSYTYPCIRPDFPNLEVLYRSSQDKKTVCHYRSKSMWYTNLCKLHWTVSKVCVTLVHGPKFYVNYVSFSAYLREQPTSFH